MPDLAVQNPDEQVRGEADSTPGRPDAPGATKSRIPLLPFDYVLIGVAAALLYPVFQIARLPLRVNFGEFASAYWGGTAAMAVAMAMLYAVLGLPRSRRFCPRSGDFVRRRFCF